MSILCKDFPRPQLVAPLIAHRGLSMVAPENTFASFELAHQAGIRWLECDIQVIADGSCIIFHDETFDRCTNRSGLVRESTIHQIDNTDAGSWFSQEFAGEEIPTLDDFLYFIEKKDLHANLELKADDPNTDYDMWIFYFLRSIEKFPAIARRILISSFSLPLLESFRKKNKIMPIALLEETSPTAFIDSMKKITASSYHTNLESCTIDIAKACSENKVDLRIYTINNSSQLLRCLDGIKPYRIAGFFSDCPDKFLETAIDSEID